MQLRNLVPGDIGVIIEWPPYSPEFEELDYALRNNGWLNEYRDKPSTWCFAVEQSDQIIAFSILSKTGEAEAEFRIALRADKIGKGLGAAITIMTLEKGFSEINLSRIHLIVRKNNMAAIRLYRRLGFIEQGECSHIINEKLTDFLVMRLLKVSYQRY